MKRECGDCTLCCKLLPVPSIGKKIGERCQHQKFGTGCAIFGQWSRPQACAVWSCVWVRDPKMDVSRPDRAHYFVDPTPDFIVLGDALPAGRRVMAFQVWVDPSHPHAHRDPALRAWLEKATEGRDMVAVARINEGHILVLVPPAMSETGRWQEMETRTMAPHSVGEIRRSIVEERLKQKAAAEEVKDG